MFLRGLYSEILVHTWQFLFAAIKQNEIVNQLDQTVLFAHLQQILIKLKAAVVLLIFFPFEEILLFGSDGTVAQPFGIIAGEYNLDCGEEPLVELFLLVGKQLADAVANGDAAVFQFQHADGNSIDVNH